MTETKKASAMQRLQQARKILRDTKIAKGAWNDFSHYSYFELKDFLPKALEAFDKVGLFSKFDLKEEHQTIKDGLVTVVPEMAVLQIINVDDKEDRIIFSSPTAEAKGSSPIQGVGSKHTYMRRYLWINALELCENDQVEANTGKPKGAPAKKTVKKVENAKDDDDIPDEIPDEVPDDIPVEDDVSADDLPF